MQMEVNWKPVPVEALKDFYVVSDWGDIHSLDRVDSLGRPVNGRLLKTRPNNSGYEVVSLYADGQRYPYTVHKLVALAFIGAVPEGTEVCHIDGDKTNNRITNLEFATHKQNCIDRLAQGVQPNGKGHYKTELTEDNVREIRQLRKDGVKRKDIAKLFGISGPAVSQIVSGKNWKHVH